MKNFPQIIFKKENETDLLSLVEERKIVLLFDHFFTVESLKLSNQFMSQVLISLSVDSTHEPSTKGVDKYVLQVKEKLPEKLKNVAIVAFGGGTTLDTAKAISVLITNPGSSEVYQGWNKVKNKSVFKIAIPTIAGTGAEVSKTAVLTSDEKKQGINDKESSFDIVLYDPKFLRTVNPYQEFYTAMDGYIHSVEAIQGKLCDVVGHEFATGSLEKIENWYLKEKKIEYSDLMLASFLGGLSVSHSEVGICHALSYGLSFKLSIPHGISNCIVMRFLGEFYSVHVDNFLKMEKLNSVLYPKKYFMMIKSLSDDQIEEMIKISLLMDGPLRNALGEKCDFKSILKKQYQLIREGIDHYSEVFIL